MPSGLEETLHVHKWICVGTRSIAPVMAVSASEPAKQPSQTALEADDDFSLEACVGRFEILSSPGNIDFKSEFSQFEVSNGPLLDADSGADFIALDARATRTMALRMKRAHSFSEELFILQMKGDDHDIEEFYVNGAPRKQSASTGHRIMRGT